jgi:hypothetical protein
MKGTLVKTEQGWMVKYDQRTWQDPSVEDGELPLHPDDVKEINELSKIFDNVDARYNGQEVEFEMTYHWDETIPQPISVGRLIKTKEDDKDRLYDTVNNVEKLADNHVESLGFITFTNDYSNERRTSFIDGYNKAKETLYTEEDVIRTAIHCWNIASKPEYGKTYNVNEIVKNYIQSLKQPK